MARWISGIILAVLVSWLVLKAPALAILVVIMLLAAIAAQEFVGMAAASNYLLRFGSAVFVCLGCLKIWQSGAFIPSVQVLFYFAAVFFFAFVSQFSGNDDVGLRWQRVQVCLVAIFYSLLLFGAVTLIMRHESGRSWLFYVLGATFLADTGAYLAGRHLGKHKLVPALSPNKTVEGLIGGILGGILGGALAVYFLPLLAGWSQTPVISVSPAVLIVGGAVLSLTGLCGDLSESMVKRACGVKDSGKLIPGHGGLLDRVDGLLFNAPLGYCLLAMFAN